MRLRKVKSVTQKPAAKPIVLVYTLQCRLTVPIFKNLKGIDTKLYVVLSVVYKLISIFELILTVESITSPFSPLDPLHPTPT